LPRPRQEIIEDRKIYGEIAKAREVEIEGIKRYLGMK
jgi:hypothetical protein